MGALVQQKRLLGKEREPLAVPATNFFFGLRERTVVIGCIRGVKALPQTVRDTISFRFSGFANEWLIIEDGQIFIR